MTLKPGLYPDTPDRVYFALDEYINSSTLRKAILPDGRVSMAHLRHALDTPPKETDAMSLGSLVHAVQLEPTTLLERFVVMPDFEHHPANQTKGGKQPSNPKNTKFYRDSVAEFVYENRDREVITKAQYATALAMCSALRRHSRAKAYLSADGPCECVVIWDETVEIEGEEEKVRCRAKIDHIAEAVHCFDDLKTTADISRFRYAIRDYSYHVQMAMYRSGLRAVTGHDWRPRWIVVQSQEPYTVNAAPIGTELLLAGDDLYQQLLHEYVAAKRNGEWSGPADPEEWDF
jgi:exodeoxyribonuclease VIII